MNIGAAVYALKCNWEFVPQLGGQQGKESRTTGSFSLWFFRDGSVSIPAFTVEATLIWWISCTERQVLLLFVHGTAQKKENVAGNRDTLQCQKTLFASSSFRRSSNNKVITSFRVLIYLLANKLRHWGGF